jgi:hypothetical protein
MHQYEMEVLSTYEEYYRSWQPNPQARVISHLNVQAKYVAGNLGTCRHPISGSSLPETSLRLTVGTKSNRYANIEMSKVRQR